MRALGVTLIEHGDDFQESREHAQHLATTRGAHMVPSFHPALISGVSTYWWEFFKAVPQLDVVYVPIGLGSGVCAAIAAKLALNHPARIVGVVSTLATTYADSLAAGRVVEAPVSTLLADGMAVRVADADALAVLTQHLDHIVQVSDAEVAQAMRDLFTDTHNVAEGAGAASFAAAMQERAGLKTRWSAPRCAAATWMPACLPRCCRALPSVARVIAAVYGKIPQTRLDSSHRGQSRRPARSPCGPWEPSTLCAMARPRLARTTMTS
jgi:threonine dehydratase